MSLKSNSTNKIITAPKHFTHTGIIKFIGKCDRIFNMKGKREKGFTLDLSKVKKTSMVGVLLIYKFVEYTINNQCFYKPNLLNSKEIEESYRKYGFWDLIDEYMTYKNTGKKEYKKLKISISKDFLIAPKALLRNDKVNRDSLNKDYLPRIEKYYSDSPKAVQMIFQVFSEILLNFWEHATKDDKSIIVAYGDKKKIEIACVDTGEGIISTLGSSLSSHNLPSEKVLRMAVKQGVTSKKMSDHMGYGLWILDEIVSRTKGKMQIYSQGAFYHNIYGKKNDGKCGFWQGAIVYISLPLKNPVTLSDIENEINGHNKDKLKINWA